MRNRIISLLLAIALTLAASGCASQTKKTSTTQTQDNQIQTTTKVEETKQLEKQSDEPLYPAYVFEGIVKKWGYINKTGKFIIQPTYDYASDFQQNGLAVVGNNELKGIIDKTGNVIIKPEYTRIDDFSQGIAIASKDWSNNLIINEKGQVLFETKGFINEFKDGLAVFSKEIDQNNSCYGYVNTNGKVIIEPQFKYANSFSGGNALVQTTDGKYAIIDKSSSIITKLNYENVRDFSEGTAIFNKSENNNTKQGYIATSGEVLLDAKYTNAYPFEDGLAVVDVSDNYEPKVGLINKKGEFIISPQYANITRLGEGLYTVAQKSITPAMSNFSRQAIFNNLGKQLTNFMYYDITLLPDSSISVSTDTSTLLINKNGEAIKGLTPVDGIGTLKLQGDLIKAEMDNEVMYLSIDGKVVWKPDNTLTLDKGLKVKQLKYRPDRCMLIYYPEISGLADKGVQDLINKDLRKNFVGDNPVSSKEEGLYTEDTVISFNAEKNKDLLIVRKDGYIYPIGAAHGQPLKIYYHKNLNSGKNYKLGDLFKKDSDYLKKLSDIIRAQIAAKSKDGGMYFNEKVEDITPEMDFIITENCLQLYYNPYAIAPYAAGFPNFDIPYGDILDLIDTEGEFWKSFDKNITKAPAQENKPVSDEVKSNIQESLKSYETNMIEAINQNNFSLVEPYLLEGSNLYNSQKKLVTSLNNQGIKEKLEGFSVEDIKESGGIYKVYVKESIGIKYPDKDFATKPFDWVYTVKLSQDKYLLSDIEKWSK